MRARYVIDASGRNSVIGSHFQLKKNYAHLQKLSVFAHYDGVTRDPGIDGTLTRLVRAADRWFWMIPLTEERMSIGVVLDAATFKEAKLSPEEFLERALDEQPVIANRMPAATRVTPVTVAADFSYRNEKLAGERWLLAGDAAGFIDPVFSSGVFLAIMAGEQAADALDVVLDRPEKRRRLFARYERTVQRAMKVYLRFVDAWYTKEFIEVFLHPQRFFQLPQRRERHPRRQRWHHVSRFVGGCGFFIPSSGCRNFSQFVRGARCCRQQNVEPAPAETLAVASKSYAIHTTLALALCALALCLPACQTTSTHQFAAPPTDWQTKTGQLAYKGRKISLIGEVLVRYSQGRRDGADLQQRARREPARRAAGCGIRAARRVRWRAGVGPARPRTRRSDCAAGLACASKSSPGAIPSRPRAAASASISAFDRRPLRRERRGSASPLPCRCIPR